MRSFSPLFLLGALGALSAVSSAAVAQVDTSEWKCQSCPFEKSGVSGTVEGGTRHVSESSAKFGDYTGVNRDGFYLTGAADIRYRDDEGQFGSLLADSDIGVISAELGREGRYALRLGYSQIPRYLSDTAMTPFLGIGGANLSLPPGYPANSTAAMPLATTLQPLDIGFTRSRVDVDASFPAGTEWTNRVIVRHDVRDGTQRSAGSFFNSASQLVAPLDQVTDQLELSTSYANRTWQASLAYNLSLFRNGADALTWSNPFSMGAPGTSQGQLALAPDNQFHQIRATGGYQVIPEVRVSADIAVGRMLQDASFLAPTLNPSLGAPVLPATSAQGQADTFNASFRVAYAPTDRVRINASYARDVRQNETPSQGFPAIAADMFIIGPELRYNQPFTFKQDRYRLDADFRSRDGVKLSAGLLEDDRERTLQDVVTTREGSIWGRLAVPLGQSVSLTLKLLHTERDNTGYGSATWVTPPENLKMRKFYLADRLRDTAGVRADVIASESVSFGLYADASNDKYPNTKVGLTEATSRSFGGDVSAALTEDTRLQAYANREKLDSNQAGSSIAATADWRARTNDTVDVVGVGVKHAALSGRLELSADLAYARSRSDTAMQAGGASSFPTATTAMDRFKLFATYRLQENLWVTGGWWYEHYDSRDWHLDGVQPDTVSNLLAFGELSPKYNVNVIRLGLRYRF